MYVFGSSHPWGQYKVLHSLREEVSVMISPASCSTAIGHFHMSVIVLGHTGFPVHFLVFFIVASLVFG